MTIKVERETGTKSETWNVIDERWERVCFLTRALLGIPQDKGTFWGTLPRQEACRRGHNMRDESNVYERTDARGNLVRNCKACQRIRLAAHYAKVQAQQDAEDIAA